MKTQMNTIAAVNEQEVVRFLQNNLDFFKTHDHLLADLEVPHETGRAISLVERQLGLLREHKQNLKRQLQDLMQIARENDQLAQRMHELTLKLINTRSVDDLITTVHTSMRKDFGVDQVAMWFFNTPEQMGMVQQSALFDLDFQVRNQFENMLRERKPVCGRFRTEQITTLLPGTENLVESVALMPLYDKKLLGLLVLGSFDTRRFHAGKGTDMLSRLSELIVAVLRLYI